MAIGSSSVRPIASGAGKRLARAPATSRREGGEPCWRGYRQMSAIACGRAAPRSRRASPSQSVSRCRGGESALAATPSQRGHLSFGCNRPWRAAGATTRRSPSLRSRESAPCEEHDARFCLIPWSVFRSGSAFCVRLPSLATSVLSESGTARCPECPFREHLCAARERPCAPPRSSVREGLRKKALRLERQGLDCPCPESPRQASSTPLSRAIRQASAFAAWPGRARRVAAAAQIEVAHQVEQLVPGRLVRSEGGARRVDRVVGDEHDARGRSARPAATQFAGGCARGWLGGRDAAAAKLMASPLHDVRDQAWSPSRRPRRPSGTRHQRRSGSRRRRRRRTSILCVGRPQRDGVRRRTSSGQRHRQGQGRPSADLDDMLCADAETRERREEVLDGADAQAARLLLHLDRRARQAVRGSPMW